MRYATFAIAAGIVLSFLGATPAQPPDEPRPRFPVSPAGMVVGNEQIQKELKLDEDQVKTLQSALKKVREDMQDELIKAREAGPEEQQRVRAKMREANDNALASVLKPVQLKRLHQIENQMQGMALFLREDVQKDLNLSDDQKEKLRQIRQDARKELQNPGTSPFQKMQEVTKAAMDKAEAVLDKDQKKELKELLGEHIVLRFQGPPNAPAGRPQPGQVLSPGLQNRLQLTAEQKKQLEELQKEVDSKLDKILTDEQRKQLKELRQGPPPGVFGGAGARPNAEK